MQNKAKKGIINARIKHERDEREEASNTSKHFRQLRAGEKTHSSSTRETSQEKKPSRSKLLELERHEKERKEKERENRSFNAYVKQLHKYFPSARNIARIIKQKEILKAKRYEEWTRAELFVDEERSKKRAGKTRARVPADATNEDRRARNARYARASRARKGPKTQAEKAKTAEKRREQRYNSALSKLINEEQYLRQKIQLKLLEANPDMTLDAAIRGSADAAEEQMREKYRAFFEKARKFENKNEA